MFLNIKKEKKETGKKTRELRQTCVEKHYILHGASGKILEFSLPRNREMLQFKVENVCLKDSARSR